MSNFRKIISMSAVVILGATNLLTPLSYANAATGYDALTTGDLKNQGLRFVMPDHDVFLYAITEANKYFVEYSGTTKTSGTMDNDTFTYDTAGDLSPNLYKKTGYTFAEWNRQLNGGGTGYADGATGVVLNWTATESGVVPIYAQWTPNTYNISYNLNKGDGSNDPVHTGSHPTTATYDSGFTVTNPSRTGYSFSGWTISNMDSEKHTVGGEESYATGASGVMGTSFENLRSTSGTVNFLAIWTKNLHTQYKVEHYLETLTSGVYPDDPKETDNLSGVTDTSVTPAIHTYEGFTANTANTPTSGNIEPDGSKVFRYEYTRNSYNLTLNAGRGIASVRGSGSVTAEKSASAGGSTTISFKYDEPVTLSFTSKAGYQNAQWSGYSATASAFNMPASHQEKTAYATPIEYTISYETNGGTNNVNNPTKYTVESGDITLQDPTGVHSDFLGWTGTDVTGTSESVTIASGSIGNRSFTAVWKCRTGYHPINGESGDNHGNCIENTDTTYTIHYLKQDLEGGENYSSAGDGTGVGTTDTDTSGRNYVDDIDHEGFTVHSVDTKNIEGDGSTEIDIKYHRNSYDDHVQDGSGITTTVVGAHDGAAAVSGQHQYGDTVTLSETTLPGYTFDHWTVEGSGLNKTINSGDANKTFTMPASDVTIKSYSTTNVYNLTIISHGGNSGSVSRTYTVEDTVTLINPKRDHSDFAGWSGTDLASPSMNVSFNGRAKDSVYEETWKCHTGYHASGANECVANQYSGSVYYDYANEHGAPVEINFTYDQVTTLENPVDSGYDFVGWRITGMSGGVEHIIGTLPVTGGTVDSTKATEFMNLSTEQGMTDIKFTAIWTARDDTKYVINHYYKDLGASTYSLSGTDNLTGVTDTDVVFENKLHNYEGFTYSGGYVNEGNETRPSGAGVTSGTIDKHGTTVINLYYDRNKWTVYLSGDEHVATLSGAGTYEYGKEVEVSVTAKTGYHFKEWKKKKDDTFTTDL